MYAWIFGIAYLAVALVELITKDDGLLLGDTVILAYGALHFIIHLAVGLVVLGSAFAGAGAAKTVARIVGVVFLAVTIWNIVAGDSYAEFVGLGEGAELPVAYTIVHAITAIAALYAGFAGGRGYGKATA
jgi:hypothetical protein